MPTNDSAKRLAKGPNSIEPVSERQRHSLVLRAWEVINSERELQGVIEAVAEVLVPVVPFFGIAIIAPEARQGAPWAMHVVGESKCKDESVDDLVQRMRSTYPAHPQMAEKKLIPYEETELDGVKEGDQPYICNDLLKKDAWMPHEFKLGAVGIRAYTAIPLQARGRAIAVLVFPRLSPAPSTPDTVTFLIAVPRAIAVAVANALANQEISRWRDQLEAETVALRAQPSRITKFEETAGDSPPLRRALEAVE